MMFIMNVWLLLVGLLCVPAPPVHSFLPKSQQFLKAVEQQQMRRRGAPSTPALHAPSPTVVATPAPAQLPETAADADRHAVYRRVAARSLGEGSFALAEIACTIKNRLRVSRAPLSAVLRAYHAADVPPAADHIEIVRQVFEGQLPCPETWWYALSLQDTYAWRPHQRPPAKTIKQTERKQILIFDR